MDRVRTTACLLLLLLCGGGVLRAAPEVRLVLEGGDEARRFVGEAFPLYLVIEDSGAVPDPDLPASEDFSLRLLGGQAAESDGKRRYTLTFEAVAMRPGNLLFPSLEVSAGGAVLATEPQAVRVEEPKETDQMLLEVSLSQEECYAGQPLTLTLTLESKLSLNGLRAVDLRVPALSDGRFRSYPIANPVPPDSPQAIGLPVEGARVIARVAPAATPEDPDRISFQQVVVPTYPGVFELDPATLVCAYVTPRETRFRGSRYPSYFNNDFFDKDLPADFEKIFCRSAPIRLRVKALPEEGRPDRFGTIGVVGRLELDAFAEPTVLKAGQPLTLTLRASGHPFPQVLGLPPLIEISGAGHHFQIPERAAPQRVETRERVATYSLRPLRPEVAEIPVIRIPFFDPATGSYGEASAGPIPIKVTKAESATAFEAEFGDGSQLRNVVVPTRPGLVANFEGADLLVPVAAHPPLARSPWFWPVLVVPPLAFLLALLRLRRAERVAADPAGHRARLAHREYRKSKAEGHDPREAAHGYLADRTRARRGAHTLEELADRVAEQGAPEEAVAVLEKAADEELADAYRNGESSGVGDGRELGKAVDQIENAQPSRKL